MMKSNWPNEELRQYARIATWDYLPGNLAIPSDGAEYGMDYANTQSEFYAELLGALAKFESNFKTDTTYEEGFNDGDGKPVISRGLLQLSLESGRFYDKQLKTAQELHDPKINLRVGVRIMSFYLQRDGVIAGGSKGKWLGMARYWAPFRKPERVKQIKAMMREVFNNQGDSMASKAAVRKLEPEMVAYLDKKLATNGMAQEAIKNKDPRALMVQAAAACVGIKEATGKNDGKFIKLIQETVGGASGEPYCMAGMMTLIAYAELKTGSKSPLMATEHCQTLWNKTPKSQRVKSIPLPGALAVWGDKGKSTGHTEIVLACDGKTMQCVGFNTSGTTAPGSKVNREGNGVFYTVRTMKNQGSRLFLGCVKPF